jgi:hypothetical protein
MLWVVLEGGLFRSAPERKPERLETIALALPIVGFSVGFSMEHNARCNRYFRPRFILRAPALPLP